MATDLVTAFTQIQKQKALAKSFSTDPEKVLIDLGVDTSKLTITKGLKRGQGVSMHFPPTPGSTQKVPLTICGSIGWILCASVGGTVEVGS